MRIPRPQISPVLRSLQPRWSQFPYGPVRQRANGHEVFRYVQAGNGPERFLSLRKIGSQFFFANGSQVKGNAAASVLQSVMDGKTDFVPWHPFRSAIDSPFWLTIIAPAFRAASVIKRPCFLGKTVGWN